MKRLDLAMGQKENPWGPQVDGSVFAFTNRVFEVPFFELNPFVSFFGGLESQESLWAKPKHSQTSGYGPFSLSWCTSYTRPYQISLEILETNSTNHEASLFHWKSKSDVVKWAESSLGPINFWDKLRYTNPEFEGSKTWRGPFESFISPELALQLYLRKLQRTSKNQLLSCFDFFSAVDGRMICKRGHPLFTWHNTFAHTPSLSCSNLL